MNKAGKYSAEMDKPHGRHQPRSAVEDTQLTLVNDHGEGGQDVEDEIKAICIQQDLQGKRGQLRLLLRIAPAMSSFSPSTGR